MAKMLEIKIDGKAFTAELLEKEAPKTCEAVLKALPLEGTLLHAAWSGDNVYLGITPDKLPKGFSVPQENPTIYGSLGDVLWYPQPHYHEFFIAHDVAQYRWKTGNLVSNLFGKIKENLEELDKLCRSIQREGGKKIVLRLKE